MALRTTRCIVLVGVLLGLTWAAPATAATPECTEAIRTYTFGECDAATNTMPTIGYFPVSCTRSKTNALPDPVVATVPCNLECPAGTFLDARQHGGCTQCPRGFYSKGDVIAVPPLVDPSLLNPVAVAGLKAYLGREDVKFAASVDTKQSSIPVMTFCRPGPCAKWTLNQNTGEWSSGNQTAARFNVASSTPAPSTAAPSSTTATAADESVATTLMFVAQVRRRSGGFLRFWYRTESEKYFDGLAVTLNESMAVRMPDEANGAVLVSADEYAQSGLSRKREPFGDYNAPFLLTGVQLTYHDISVPLPYGDTEVRFVFRKDANQMSLQWQQQQGGGAVGTDARLSDGTIGADRAFLRNIEIEGTRSDVAIRRCEPCPPGYYGDADGETDCHACAADHYAVNASGQAPEFGMAATGCLPCPPNTYAPPGSTKCLPLPPCQTSDYVAAYGPCDTQTLKRQRVWTIGIDVKCLGGAPPPSTVPELVPCGACPFGGYRNEHNECSVCPLGNVREKRTDGGACVSCQAGSYGLPVARMEDGFDAFARGATSAYGATTANLTIDTATGQLLDTRFFTSSCEGACPSCSSMWCQTNKSESFKLFPLRRSAAAKDEDNTLVAIGSRSDGGGWFYESQLVYDFTTPEQSADVDADDSDSFDGANGVGDEGSISDGRSISLSYFFSHSNMRSGSNSGAVQVLDLGSTRAYVSVDDGAPVELDVHATSLESVRTVTLRIPHAVETFAATPEDLDKEHEYVTAAPGATPRPGEMIFVGRHKLVVRVVHDQSETTLSWGSTPEDVSLMITALVVAGDVRGQAETCATCPPGHTCPGSGAILPTMCPAGTYRGYSSKTDGTEKCSPCAFGTVASGGAYRCHECAAGLTPAADRSRCVDRCLVHQQTPSGVPLTWDMAIARGVVFGPIVAGADPKAPTVWEKPAEGSAEAAEQDLYDSTNTFRYFVSMCGRLPASVCAQTSQPNRAYGAMGYACQRVNADQSFLMGKEAAYGVDMSTGSPQLTLSYYDGKRCRAGPRRVNITTVCDMTGITNEVLAESSSSLLSLGGRAVGSKAVLPAHGVLQFKRESPSCVYHFEWRSALACPQCSVTHYAVTRGICYRKVNEDTATGGALKGSQSVSLALKPGAPSVCYGRAIDTSATNEPCAPQCTVRSYEARYVCNATSGVETLVAAVKASDAGCIAYDLAEKEFIANYQRSKTADLPAFGDTRDCTYFREKAWYVRYAPLLAACSVAIGLGVLLYLMRVMDRHEKLRVRYARLSAESTGVSMEDAGGVTSAQDMNEAHEAVTMPPAVSSAAGGTRPPPHEMNDGDDDFVGAPSV